MGRFRRSVSGLAALVALAAGVAIAIPAVAAPPTRISDTVSMAFVDAAEADRTLEIALWRSEVAGMEAVATLHGGPEGSFLAEGWGPSDWTDTTFRATIELFDDDGATAGTVTVEGSYAPDGQPSQDVQKFNDGNLRVHMDHTTTELALDGVSVALDGVGWDTTPAGGFHEVGKLFVTNPATFVHRDQYVAFGESETENIEDFFLDGTLDDLGVNITFADADAHTAGAIDVSRGAWSGTFRLLDLSGEELGEVAATATLTPLGAPTRLFDRVRGGYEKWTVTLYELILTVEGPIAPARLTVQIADVSYAIHTPPGG